MEKKIIESMQALGFTSSEAKIYLALLKHPDCTGYEVAAHSGVPRSAIYGILKRLESQGLVNSLGEKPTKWTPIPPGRLYELMEGSFTSSLDSLKDSLKSLNTPTTDSFLWQLQGHQAMLDNAQALLNKAENFVAASIWSSEAERLRPGFEKAIERGVKVVLFSFTPLPPLGETFSYQLDEEVLTPHWSRKMILVADHQWALVGQTEVSPESHGVLTKDQAIVEMAVNNLVLDITLFGQRQERDTSEVTEFLLDRMAPLDQLLSSPR